MVNESWIIAELLRGQMPQSGAPWVGKSGNLSIREILVVTLAYLRPSIRPSVRMYVARTNAGGGGGEFQGNPKATQSNPLTYLLTYLLACLLTYLLTYLFWNSCANFASFLRKKELFGAQAIHWLDILKQLYLLQCR